MKLATVVLLALILLVMGWTVKESHAITPDDLAGGVVATMGYCAEREDELVASEEVTAKDDIYICLGVVSKETPYYILIGWDGELKAIYENSRPKPEKVWDRGWKDI